MSIISELDALKMAQTIRTIQLVEMKAKRRRAVERALYYRKLARERERQFPMLDGPAIPWSLAETIYGIYSALYGTRQSLERIAERGGFGWLEIGLFLRDARYRDQGESR